VQLVPDGTGHCQEWVTIDESRHRSFPLPDADPCRLGPEQRQRSTLGVASLRARTAEPARRQGALFGSRRLRAPGRVAAPPATAVQSALAVRRYTNAYASRPSPAV
jgi:hypothetical protein